MRAIRTARMFDGTRMHGESVVLVEDGRIVDVETSGRELAAGIPVTDLGDSCLLPGLIDTHVHLGFDASADPISAIVAGSDAQILGIMRASAQRSLQAGITTVRDLGDRNFLSLRLRDELRQVTGSGPEILVAGPPITSVGGHCHFLGGAVDGMDALLEAVRERHARGCDVVKIMASGGNITPGSAPYRNQFTREELRLVVLEAHRLGLPVCAHAQGVDSMRDALAAGVDTIEHAFFMTETGVETPEDLLDDLAAAPLTISMSAGLIPGGVAPPPAVARSLSSVFAAMTRLKDHGAAMVIGTDAGVGPNKPHDVLPYAVEQATGLGWDPLGALTMATATAADVCGLRKGRIQPGADADLLAVAGDPLTDLARLRDVRAVYRGGVRVR
ncbi:amidohydrolase family protein [Catenuloplanes japonicus]|uniref:amidohydrolase family protein n=1 Tax=Catenuloplanes japonicus TaxID=33876 RepID=UPI000526C572|nr:amidohydrolase family protein [Catenuloplanes japonicus]